MLATFYFALMLTLSIETWIYRWLKRSSITFLLLVMGMNIVLNPIMNEFLQMTSFDRYWAMLIFLEIIVILLETIIVHFASQARWSKSFLVAMLANSASLLIGLLFNQFIFTQQALWIGSFVLSLPLLGLCSWMFFKRTFRDKRD
jgi:hypothetical protein